MFGKRNVATLVAEFLGTGILTLVLLSVSRSTISIPYFIAMAVGLSIAMITFALGRVSGSHLNPALTIGLAVARKVTVVKAVTFIAAQLLGAWAAYHLFVYYIKTPLPTNAGKYSGRVLIAEAVGTAIFTFAWASALYQRLSPALSGSVAGIGYMIGSISASTAAFGLLNPALALGVHAWTWLTYVLGPVLGAIIGVNLYGQLFAESDNAVVAAKASPVVVKKTTTRTTKTTKKPAAKKSAKRTTKKK